MLSIIAVATARNRSMHASIIDDNSMTCNDSHVVDALMMSMMFNDVDDDRCLMMLINVDALMMSMM